MYLKYFITWAQVIAINNDMKKKKPFFGYFFHTESRYGLQNFRSIYYLFSIYIHDGNKLKMFSRN